jgi:hypothetical protein
MRPCFAAPLVVAALTSLPSRASAYRPFDGTDADVADLGEFELELGPSHYYRLGPRNYLLAPATVLNLGIFDATELVVDFQNIVALNQDDKAPPVALVGTDVLLKHVFRRGILQGQSGLSVALEGGPLTPEIQGTNAWGASLSGIVSYQWPALTVHFNEWAELTRRHNAYLFNGVILEGPHDWTVRPVMELFYSHEWNLGDETSALAGAIWNVRDALALDLGVRGSRLRDEYTLEIRLGFTWGVALWAHDAAPLSPKPPTKLTACASSGPLLARP